MRLSSALVLWLATATLSAQNQPITLPAGTEISVRTVTRIESKHANLSKDYAASLDDPILVNGETVVPANANAFLRVSNVKSPGLGHRAAMSMSLVAVIIDGQRISVETDKVDSTAGSQARRTATGAVAGAAGGAIIGAIAGGGIGAAVGAGAGAMGGAIAGKLTGKGVEIAPETRFTYRLTQPATINGSATPR